MQPGRAQQQVFVCGSLHIAAGMQACLKGNACVTTWIVCMLRVGLRMTKAHVTHPELKATFNLDILGVKKNPNGTMYSSLGVITKGE